MENVCDICGQSCAGLMFEVRNEKGEREERRICFDCIAKRAQAKVDVVELPTQRGD